MVILLSIFLKSPSPYHRGDFVHKPRILPRGQMGCKRWRRNYINLGIRLFKEFLWLNSSVSLIVKVWQIKSYRNEIGSENARNVRRFSGLWASQVYHRRGVMLIYFSFTKAPRNIDWKMLIYSGLYSFTGGRKEMMMVELVSLDFTADCG